MLGFWSAGFAQIWTVAVHAWTRGVLIQSASIQEYPGTAIVIQTAKSCTMKATGAFPSKWETYIGLSFCVRWNRGANHHTSLFSFTKPFNSQDIYTIIWYTIICLDLFRVFRHLASTLPWRLHFVSYPWVTIARFYFNNRSSILVTADVRLDASFFLGTGQAWCSEPCPAVYWRIWFGHQ